MSQYEYHMQQAAKREKSGNLVRAEKHLDLAEQSILNRLLNRP